MNDIIYNNKEALSVIDSYAFYVKELCLPLQKYLGIKYFGYAKVFHEGLGYIFESNYYPYLEDFFYKITESGIRGMQCVHYSNKYYIALWPNEPKGASSTLLYRHNIWNGITFTRVNDNYIELWTFAGDPNNANLSFFYLKHIRCLERFITHYESKVSVLRNKRNQTLARLLNYNFSLPGLDDFIKENETLNEFLSYIAPDGYELSSRNGFIRLTKREYECLGYLGNGATLKSIAKKLQLSPKTIEAHVNNIRLKTGIHYKADLADWFHEVREV